MHSMVDLIVLLHEKDNSDIRVKVKEASWNTALETMEILRVVPEERKMSWKTFLNYISSIFYTRINKAFALD